MAECITVREMPIPVEFTSRFFGLIVHLIRNDIEYQKLIKEIRKSGEDNDDEQQK